MKKYPCQDTGCRNWVWAKEQYVEHLCARCAREEAIELQAHGADLALDAAIYADMANSGELPDGLEEKRNGADGRRDGRPARMPPQPEGCPF